jgi:hypothetical protein
LQNLSRHGLDPDRRSRRIRVLGVPGLRRRGSALPVRAARVSPEEAEVTDTPAQDNVSPVAADKLEGAKEIADYLGPQWDARRVRQARERKWSIPIRRRDGVGLYAFKSELDAWLKAADTLVERKRA